MRSSNLSQESHSSRDSIGIKNLDLLNNCPPFGTYLRIAAPINKSSKLALELCIVTSNFAAI